MEVDGLDHVGLQDRQEEGENGDTRPVKTEKRKKGCAVAGRASRSVRPCQMRVAPHSLFLLPTILWTVWSSRLLLMRDSSRGTAGCGAASEHLAAPVALRGAMALPVGDGLQREDGRLKGFRGACSLERVTRRRCAVKDEKEPSLPSFEGGREGTVSKTLPLMRWFECPLLFARCTISTPLRLTNCSRATCLQFCVFTWSSDRAC
jgi:hypothetical protein